MLKKFLQFHDSVLIRDDMKTLLKSKIIQAPEGSKPLGGHLSQNPIIPINTKRLSSEDELEIEGAMIV